MAMGDSISAAFAARGGLREDRDIAWSDGKGSEDQMTFPWLISKYNPSVDGMSTKRVFPSHYFTLPHGDYHPKTDNLNLAESSSSVLRKSFFDQW